MSNEGRSHPVSTLLPLRPGTSIARTVSAAPWRLLSRRASDLRKAVVEQHAYECSFCGLISRKYLDVVADSSHPLDVEAMATVCIFCESTLFLEGVETMKNSALVWLPGVQRPALNALMRAIYVARITQGTPAELARAIHERLMLRRKPVADVFGSGDPVSLAMKLADAPDDETVEKVRVAMANVLVLPLDRRIIREEELEFNQFPQILAYWRSKDGPFAGGQPTRWDLTPFDEILATDFSPASMALPRNWVPRTV